MYHEIDIPSTAAIMLAAYSNNGVLERGAKKDLVRDIKSFIGLTKAQKEALIVAIKTLYKAYVEQRVQLQKIAWERTHKEHRKNINRMYYKRRKQKLKK